MLYKATASGSHGFQAVRMATAQPQVQCRADHCMAPDRAELCTIAGAVAIALRNGSARCAEAEPAMTSRMLLDLLKEFGWWLAHIPVSAASKALLDRIPIAVAVTREFGPWHEAEPAVLVGQGELVLD